MFARKTITIPQMNALFFDIKASSFDIEAFSACHLDYH